MNDSFDDDNINLMNIKIDKKSAQLKQKINQICGYLISFSSILCCSFKNTSMKIIKQGEVGLLEEFAKFIKILKPGIHYYNPVSQKIKIVSLKQKNCRRNFSKAYSKECIQIQFDFAVCYEILNPVKATYQVDNLNQMVLDLVEISLNSMIGKTHFEFLQNLGDNINFEYTILMEEEYGVNICEIYLESIRVLDGQIFQQMNNMAAMNIQQIFVKQYEYQCLIEMANLTKNVSSNMLNKNTKQMLYQNVYKSLISSPNSKLVLYKKT